ncbi:MAG: histidinol-phosphate phosphatase family protein [Ferruginibacter sp.]|nr:histidinol-phosphate phosphatase family protein [Ferruginibacter sp.]
MSLPKIDKDWTLFLDRDGVINVENPLGYINTWDEFIFYEGVKEAIKIFAGRFKYIFVVSNQRGVAKGITRPGDLSTIHHNMTVEIKKNGGRIDKIYFCTDMESSSPNRKPNPGMGLQAKKDFQNIDFSKAIMVGNNISDMEFGRNLGCTTIFLTTTNPGTGHDDPRVDFVYNSLLDFAKAL